MAELNTVAELEARNAEIDARIAELDAAAEGRSMTDEESTEWNALGAELKANEERAAEIAQEIEDRKATILAASKRAENRENGFAGFNTRGAGVVTGDDIYQGEIRSLPAGELTERAMRSIDSHTFLQPNVEQGDAQGRVEKLLRSIDPNGGASEMSRTAGARVLATGSPTYERAFAKITTGRAHMMTAVEADAAERALQVSSTGNYPVPFVLDPTLINATSAALNPIRSVADVTQIPGNTWKGVTATTPTATRVGEITAATDGTPTLTQPSLTTKKAQVFIPFSYETEQDWSALQAELAKLIQRSKDLEEATAFVTGSGSGNNPQGFVTGGTAVTTTGAGAFALGDLYALLESLSPEWQAEARFMGTLKQYDRIRQFDTAGGAALWRYLTDGVADAPGSAGTLLGRPAHIASTMSTALTTGSKIMAFGDFSKFKIVDSIGLDIQYIPWLTDASTGYPNGSKGIYAHWRNDAKVLVAAAISVLTTS